MANRHLSRSIVLQTLFEWDFLGRKDESLENITKRNIEEFAPGMENDSFAEDLISKIIKKRKVIDEVIEKAAPEWPIDKISIIDRNVLRIGLYELLFGEKNEVPPKVAINEAIEIAKTFGGENSGKFVNGVLGAVYKEMGEPGKEDTANKNKKKSNEPVDISKLLLEELGGAVVYSVYEGDIYLALVHDVFGYWTLSKGKIEKGEDLISGTKREIKEEISLDIEIEDKIAENEYVASHPEKGKLRKHVAYFLAKSEHVPVVLGEEGGGLNDAKWFPLSEIASLTMYDDIVPIITKAIGMIKKS